MLATDSATVTAMADDASLRDILARNLQMVVDRKLIAGEQRILNVLKKGELLGDFALFRNAPRSATAIAVEPVTLMVIPANRLDHMVRSNPGLAMAIIRDLANRMLAAEERAREAEGRAAAAEERARDAETRALAAEGLARRPAPPQGERG